MYLNKALIIGNLTRDPEVKALPSGIKVTSFSVATNRVWKDKDGKKQEAADYHNVVVFGRQAEIVGQYLKKGSQVMLEGRLQTRSWDGQDGKKNYRTEIIAERVQFGSKAPGSGSSGSYSAPSSSPSTNTAPDMDDAPSSDLKYPDEEINVEDIPF